MWFTLSRFMSFASAQSGGERNMAMRVALAGVSPRRRAPSTSIPSRSSALRKAPVVKIAGSSTTTW